ncbi:helix-turn-helix domain-containing protein [Nocardiopsis sp. CNT-189]|uniref:helix-turn-helix transcriptional regulator n=1 Tax=Nocardiopsis oceanisediminis TaxID=2816862 RepID=UPI003B2F0943
MADGDLVGREAEAAAVDGLLGRIRGGGGARLVVRGRPGIGKSALLRYAEAASPVRVLRATAGETEGRMAFALLHQLLHPALGLSGALPEPQRDALRGALGLGSGADDRFLVSAAVTSLLAEAAQPGGLLCVVDDVHWADRASADALLFAARRLDGHPVGLLFGTREDPDALYLLRGLPELRLDGLGGADAARLLAEHAPEPPAPAVAARVAEATGGHPLALREAARLLTPAQLTGAAPLPDPLPAGEGVTALYRERIAGLPAEARSALLAVALDGSGDPAVGGSAEVLGPAEEAGLVELGAGGVRFGHPLVRSAVVAAASAAERRGTHRLLAGLLDGRDPDRAARHRAAAAVGPDEEAAAALAAAAGRAGARGGHADAAGAYRLAAELSPPGEARAGRLRDAAEAAWLGGLPGQAQSSLAAARAEARAPEARLALERLRGRFELASGDAAEALRILLAAAEGAGGPLAWRVLADAAEAAAYVGDTGAAARVGALAEALPVPGRGSERFLRDVLAGDGARARGEAERGAGLLRRALRGLPDDEDDPALLLWAASAASMLGDAAAAAAYGARAGRAARVSGVAGTLPVVLENAATGERFNGDIALSAALSEEGLLLAEESGAANSAAAHHANLAVCDALRGREESCRAHAREALAIAVPHRLGLRAGVAAYALGLLDLGAGRFAQAHERLAPLASPAPGMGSPVNAWGSAADRVEAAVAAGDLGAARETTAFLAGWVAEREAPRARALLARCEALTLPDAEGVGLLQEALEALTGVGGAGFDRARTALLLGERLRRGRRPAEARPHLRAAAEAFQRMGAAPWEGRASGELRAAGGAAEPAGPGALDALTPQELRIARLVAEGASNRDVAARLFLSPRTVEYHLYKVYPKLGIGSRTELVRLLAP